MLLTIKNNSHTNLRTSHAQLLEKEKRQSVYKEKNRK